MGEQTRYIREVLFPVRQQLRLSTASIIPGMFRVLFSIGIKTPQAIRFGTQGGWQPVKHNLRTFTKLNNNLLQMPVLQIQYSPKPKAPSGIATRLQANSGKGMINLQWSSVTGAKGYRVYLYNGKEFEQVYDGVQKQTGPHLAKTYGRLMTKLSVEM